MLAHALGLVMLVFAGRVDGNRQAMAALGNVAPRTPMHYAPDGGLAYPELRGNGIHGHTASRGGSDFDYSGGGQFRAALLGAPFNRVRVFGEKTSDTGAESLRVGMRPMPITARAPIGPRRGAIALLSSHVTHVVGMGAKEQVIRPHARPVIAVVADEQPLRDRPVVQFPGEHMGVVSLRSSTERHISVLGRLKREQPASAQMRLMLRHGAVFAQQGEEPLPSGGSSVLQRSELPPAVGVKRAESVELHRPLTFSGRANGGRLAAHGEPPIHCAIGAACSQHVRPSYQFTSNGDARATSTHALDINAAVLTVYLVFAGNIQENRATLANYTRHVVEDGFLSRTHVTATYGGGLDAPAIDGTTYADVDAWVTANLVPGPLYLITVPTHHAPIGTAGYQPYHVRGSIPYAVLPLPALPGFWQVSASHELVEMVSATEVADSCESAGARSDGTYVYARYEGDDGECA